MEFRSRHFGRVSCDGLFSRCLFGSGEATEGWALNVLHASIIAGGLAAAPFSLRGRASLHELQNGRVVGLA
jgi:hypothetical protein